MCGGGKGFWAGVGVVSGFTYGVNECSFCMPFGCFATVRLVRYCKCLDNMDSGLNLARLLVRAPGCHLTLSVAPSDEMMTPQRT